MISSGFSIPRAGGWQGGRGGDQAAPSPFLSGGFSVLPVGSLAAVAPADACVAAARSHPPSLAPGTAPRAPPVEPPRERQSPNTEFHAAALSFPGEVTPDNL